MVVSDVQAACIGAHGGRDGGVVVAGTGSIGWAERAGHHDRVGGWGFPLSDEGSGAWLGAEALRRVLWAHDGHIPWSPGLQELSDQFRGDPHAIVRFMTRARPRDFARFAPIVVAHAASADSDSAKLLRAAAGHIDALFLRLIALGSRRIALVGGLSVAVAPGLSAVARAYLVVAEADALAGALRLARRLLLSSTAEGDLAHG
jgi:glucosamine kinase